MWDNTLMPENTPKPPADYIDAWDNASKLTEEQFRSMYTDNPYYQPDEFAQRALRVIQEKGAREERLKWRVITDTLTGIGNPDALAAWAEEYYNPEEKAYILLSFDLINFKRINDILGQDVGDIAIQLFAKKLYDNFRTQPEESGPSGRKHHTQPDAVFARNGGDEFIAVLEKHSDSQTEDIIESLGKRFDEKLSVSAEELLEVITERNLVISDLSAKLQTLCEGNPPALPLRSRQAWAVSDPVLQKLTFDELKQAANQAVAERKQQEKMQILDE